MDAVVAAADDVQEPALRLVVAPDGTVDSYVIDHCDEATAAEVLAQTFAGATELKHFASADESVSLTVGSADTKSYEIVSHVYAQQGRFDKAGCHVTVMPPVTTSHAALQDVAPVGVSNTGVFVVCAPDSGKLYVSSALACTPAAADTPAQVTYVRLSLSAKGCELLGVYRAVVYAWDPARQCVLYADIAAETRDWMTLPLPAELASTGPFAARSLVCNGLFAALVLQQGDAAFMLVLFADQSPPFAQRAFFLQTASPKIPTNPYSMEPEPALAGYGRVSSAENEQLCFVATHTPVLVALDDIVPSVLTMVTDRALAVTYRVACGGGTGTTQLLNTASPAMAQLGTSLEMDMASGMPLDEYSGLETPLAVRSRGIQVDGGVYVDGCFFTVMPHSLSLCHPAQATDVGALCQRKHLRYVMIQSRRLPAGVLDAAVCGSTVITHLLPGQIHFGTTSPIIGNRRGWLFSESVYPAPPWPTRYHSVYACLALIFVLCPDGTVLRLRSRTPEEETRHLPGLMAAAAAAGGATKTHQ